jgi:dihydrofolate reductase
MKTTAFIAMSLDGFIAKHDGDIEWLRSVEMVGEDYGYGDFWESIDGLIIGNNTYKKIMTFPEYPYGDKKLVILKSGVSPQQALAQFKQDAHLYIDGGMTIRSFITQGLLDELIISIIPILLGNGIPLFTEMESTLTLIGSKSFDSGLVQLHYRL